MTDKNNSKSRIYILAAPIQSGKTTAVYNWAKEQKSIGGFMTPDMDGLRYTYLPSTKRWLAFETKNPLAQESIVSVGKFRFFQTAFEEMEKAMIDDLKEGLSWVVVDELGKLEVAGKGLATVAKTALDMVKARETDSRCLLIVREELLERVVDYFSIDTYKLLTLDDFQNGNTLL